MDKKRSFGVTVFAFIEGICGFALLLFLLYRLVWLHSSGGLYGPLEATLEAVVDGAMIGLFCTAAYFTRKLKPAAMPLNFILIGIVLVASFAGLGHSIVNVTEINLLGTFLSSLGIFLGLLAFFFLNRSSVWKQFDEPARPHIFVEKGTSADNFKLGRRGRIVVLLIIFGIILGYALFPFYSSALFKILDFVIAGWSLDWVGPTFNAIITAFPGK